MSCSSAVEPFLGGSASSLPDKTDVKGFQVFIGLGLGWLLCAATALAGPPLITDDPDTPGPNSWEIDFATTSQKSSHSWQLETPLLDMNYGVGEHIELTYEIAWNVLVPDVGPARGGLGNSLFGVKWRFLDQTNAWLDVSVYPQIIWNNPTSSVRRGLADDGTGVLLPVEAGHHFGPLDVYSEGGYQWNQREPTDGFFGIAAEYELTEKFTMMGELHDDFERAFDDNELIFNLGFRRELNEHISVIGSAGRAIYGPSDTTPDFLSYLALEFTL
jgi:hypothetical protein